MGAQDNPGREPGGGVTGFVQVTTSHNGLPVTAKSSHFLVAPVIGSACGPALFAPMSEGEGHPDDTGGGRRSPRSRTREVRYSATV